MVAPAPRTPSALLSWELIHQAFCLLLPVQLFLQTHFVMVIRQTLHWVPERTKAGTAWPPSNAGSFAVLLPLLERLVAHGGVTGACRPRTAPFARVSWGSRLPRDALAARVADPIKASGSLDPCGARDLRDLRDLRFEPKQLERLFSSVCCCGSVLYTPGSPGAPGAP